MYRHTCRTYCIFTDLLIHLLNLDLCSQPSESIDTRLSPYDKQPQNQLQTKPPKDCPPAHLWRTTCLWSLLVMCDADLSVIHIYLCEFLISVLTAYRFAEKMNKPMMKRQTPPNEMSCWGLLVPTTASPATNSPTTTNIKTLKHTKNRKHCLSFNFIMFIVSDKATCTIQVSKQKANIMSKVHYLPFNPPGVGFKASNSRL